MLDPSAFSFGTQKWPGGAKYEGDHVEGTITGRGKFWWPDGKIYEGEFLDGKLEGHGITKFTDGSRHEGIYHEDKMHGHGIYVFADGRRYEGDYSKNSRHGFGAYTDSEGTKWEGSWQNCKPVLISVTFTDGVRTDAVRPRLLKDLSKDETLQFLEDDARAWKIRYDAEKSPSKTSDAALSAAGTPEKEGGPAAGVSMAPLRLSFDTIFGAGDANKNGKPKVWPLPPPPPTTPPWR